MAFCESDASKRIKNALRYKKPRLISAVVAAFALAVISLVCLTDASETAVQEADDASDEENCLEDTSEPITVAPFENILGYNGRVVKRWFASITTYYFFDENNKLLFTTFGEEYFVRDLNGDGENELISNRVFADGACDTCVFVKKDNEIYMGYLDDLLDEPYDNVHYTSEYSEYRPKENVVEIFYWIEADQAYRSKKYEIDLDKLTYDKASEVPDEGFLDVEIMDALEAADDTSKTPALEDGYKPADITYVENSETGWDYYHDNPWSTDEKRDRLAQRALHYAGTTSRIWVL